jgi:hypothetical protein
MLDFWRNLIDAGLFAAEVQGVIALRLMRLASGGSESSAEIRRMVTEKFTALSAATTHYKLWIAHFFQSNAAFEKTAIDSLAFAADPRPTPGKGSHTCGGRGGVVAVGNFLKFYIEFNCLDHEHIAQGFKFDSHVRIGSRAPETSFRLFEQIVWSRSVWHEYLMP